MYLYLIQFLLSYLCLYLYLKLCEKRHNISIFVFVFDETYLTEALKTSNRRHTLTSGSGLHSFVDWILSGMKLFNMTVCHVRNSLTVSSVQQLYLISQPSLNGLVQVFYELVILQSCNKPSHWNTDLSPDANMCTQVHTYFTMTANVVKYQCGFSFILISTVTYCWLFPSECVFWLNNIL